MNVEWTVQSHTHRLKVFIHNTHTLITQGDEVSVIKALNRYRIVLFIITIRKSINCAALGHAHNTHAHIHTEEVVTAL